MAASIHSFLGLLSLQSWPPRTIRLRPSESVSEYESKLLKEVSIGWDPTGGFRDFGLVDAIIEVSAVGIPLVPGAAVASKKFEIEIDPKTFALTIPGLREEIEEQREAEEEAFDALWLLDDVMRQIDEASEEELGDRTRESFKAEAIAFVANALAERFGIDPLLPDSPPASEPEPEPEPSPSTAGATMKIDFLTATDSGQIVLDTEKFTTAIAAAEDPAKFAEEVSTAAATLTQTAKPNPEVAALRTQLAEAETREQYQDKYELAAQLNRQGKLPAVVLHKLFGKPSAKRGDRIKTFSAVIGDTEQDKIDFALELFGLLTPAMGLGRVPRDDSPNPEDSEAADKEVKAFADKHPVSRQL